jgi:hypothetical protein
MTPQAINRAIHEWMGLGDHYHVMKWGLYYRPDAHGYTSNPNEAWILPYAEAKKHEYPHDEPVTIKKVEPRNYYGDLNAMHEAESRLIGEQQEKYVIHIWRRSPLYVKNGFEWNQAALSNRIWWSLSHATAAERAQAIVHTIGKWQ